MNALLGTNGMALALVTHHTYDVAGYMVDGVVLTLQRPHLTKGTDNLLRIWIILACVIADAVEAQVPAAGMAHASPSSVIPPFDEILMKEERLRWLM